MRHRLTTDVHPLVAFALALFAAQSIAMPAHAQNPPDPPKPALHLRFDDADNVKQHLVKREQFGADEIVLVEGVAGRAIHGLRGWVHDKHLKPAWNAKAGTVSAWLRLDRKQADESYYTRWLIMLADPRHDLALKWRSNKPFINGVDNAAHHDRPVIHTGEWRHWAMVWQGGTRRLYIDGRRVSEAESEPFAEKPPAVILSSGEKNIRWALDEFKLYNTALSEAQVQALAGAHADARRKTDAPPAPERQLLENARL